MTFFLFLQLRAFDSLDECLYFVLLIPEMYLFLDLGLCIAID